MIDGEGCCFYLSFLVAIYPVEHTQNVTLLMGLQLSLEVVRVTLRKELSASMVGAKLSSDWFWGCQNSDPEVVLSTYL